MQVYPSIAPTKWVGYGKTVFVAPTLDRAQTSPAGTASLVTLGSLQATNADVGFAGSRRRSVGDTSAVGGLRMEGVEMHKSAGGIDTANHSTLVPAFGASHQPLPYDFAYPQSPFIELSSPPFTTQLLPDSSPAHSNHNSAQSRGEATPRAEIPAPIWPLSFGAYTNPVGRSVYGMDGFLDKDEMRKLEQDLERTLQEKAKEGRKYDV
jgi:hypothetical protein